MQNHKTVSLRKRKDRFLRQCLAVILSVALMVTMSGITPGSNWQAQAADELSVITEQPILLVSGDGIITGGDYTADNISYEKSYTLEELQDLEEITQLYSAINTSPTKSIYLGRGIAVDTLLQEANVPTDNYGNYEIDVVSSDGYTVRFDPTKTGDSATRGKPLKTPAFDAERYYFPNINELVVDLDDVGNYIYSNEDAASVGAESTKTILAWERGGERGFPDVVPTETGELASDEQPLLLMIGQQNAHEQNNPLFNKVVQKIMVGAALDVPLITIDGIDYTRSDLLMMERADRAYTYSASGEDKTDYARGVPLAALLSDYDDTDVVSFTAADGFTVTASGMTVGELISSNYMLAYENGDSESNLTSIYSTAKKDPSIHGYFTLYGEDESGNGVSPAKMINNITVTPAGYVDYTNSTYKHINNGGLAGSAPYNIDAITGATLTVEGPGLEVSTPIRMGDLEATDNNNLYRGVYSDSRDGTSVEFNYEGVKVLAVIDGLVNNNVEKVDENVQIIFKNRWRQDIGSISYADLANAQTPVILAYGTGTVDESAVAPFVFDGDTGYIAVLDNDDGCIKLVYDQVEFPDLSASNKFVSVAYIYVERGGEVPGYKHIDALDDAYRNTANLEQMITFTGSALGYEVNYTVEELEGMVEYGTDGLPVADGLGYRDEYNLSNTTYWYVNEYEGIKLWDLLTTELGVDPATYSTDENTLVSFAAWDNYQTTARFSMAQLADPDRFYFYEKSPLDIGTNRPTKEQLATEEYWPDNQDPLEWTTDDNGYPVKKGYPVMLAYGVNGYPYVRDSSLPGYAGGLGNDGGPIRVIFGKTDGLNRSNPSAPENYAYFYNNGSNQLQRAQEIYVGDAVRYSTHLENPNYISMKDTPAALTVEIKQGGTTTSKTYTLGELESILYGADVTKSDREKQGRQEKGYYAHKVYNENLLEDLFEGVNLWYLLSEDIGMQGVLGTVSLYSGVDETSSLDMPLTELQSEGFNSLRSTEGLGTMVAFAKNGYPMVFDSSSEGYVKMHPIITTKTIKNSDGPLMFVQAQTEAEKAAGTPGATVKNLTKIVVNLEADVYAHTDGDYLQYADDQVAFTGAVKNEGVTLTVSDIEKMQRFMVTDSYTIGGVTTTYRGIDLSKLLSSSSVGASALLNEVTVSNGTDTKTITVANMTGALKPVILAYGIGKVGGDPAGKPLVPDDASAGYDAEYLNSGGPLKLIIAGAATVDCIENVNSIAVTAAELTGWTHSTGYYADYKDNTLSLSGTNLSQSVTMTVEELEALSDTYKVFDQYKMGNLLYFEGIDLLKLFRDHIGFTAGLETSAITVYAKDGYAISFTASDLTNGVNGKPIILAYGQGTSADNGLPLVDGDDQRDIRDGFDANIGNAFGPLRLVVNDNTGWCNKWVTSIVVGSAGGGEPPAAVDFKLTNGEEVTNYSIKNIKSITEGLGGQATASYVYTSSDQLKTDYVKGVYLADLLTAAGVSGDQAKVTLNMTDGFETKQASYRDIPLADLSSKAYFLAYDAGTSADALTAILDEDKNGVEATVRIYRNHDDGSTWLNRVTNVSGITVSGADINYTFDVYEGTGQTGDLPMASVRDVVTDAGGMWVGTNGGGAWYKLAESNEFTINTLNSEGYILGSDVVQAIAVDSTGGIWFSQSKTYNPAQASLNKGVAYLKDGVITYYSTDIAGTIPNNYVQEVKIDASGNVWFGSFGGLTRYEPGTGTWTNWNQSYIDGDGESFPALSVDNIHFDNNGGVWLGFYPNGAGTEASPFVGGFAHMTAEGDITPYQYEADYNSDLGSSLLAQVWVRDIAIDQNGGAWVVASGSYTDLANVGGTVWYVNSSGTATKYTGDDLLGAGALTSNNEIRMVNIDEAGGVWFGTSGDGLYYIAEPGTTAPLTITAQYNGANGAWPDTAQFNNIYALNIIDDVMYLGSDAGVMVAAMEDIIPADEPIVIESFTISGVGTADIPYYVGGTYDKTFKGLADGAGKISSSYAYNGTTHYVKGALLSTLLADAGAGHDITVTITTSDGYTKASYQDISYADLVAQNYFVAYDVGEGTETLSKIADADGNGVTASFRIYRNYDTGADGNKENRIKGVTGITVTAVPNVIESFTISGVGTADTPYYVGGTYDKTFKGLADGAGKISSSYAYNGTTHYVKGALLSTLLADAGAGTNTKVTVITSDGYTKASYQNIPYADIVSQNYFVAYDVGEGTDILSKIADVDDNGVTASFRMYRNLDVGAEGNKDNRIKGVTGIVVSPTGGGTTPGEYDLTIDGSGVNNTAQYSLAQLKNAAASYTVTKSYNWLNSYGTTGADTFEGIYLEDLLKNVAGLRSSARSITVTASDGYYREFNLDSANLGVYWTDIQGNQIMLAWERNGSPCDLQLVVGQTSNNHVNKPMWVSDIVSITVNASSVTPGSGTTGSYEGQKPDLSGDIIALVEPTVTVEGDTASATAKPEDIQKALEELKKQAGEDDNPILNIDMSSSAASGQIKNTEINLSAEVIKDLAATGVAVSVKTDLGEMLLSPEVLQQMASGTEEAIRIIVSLTETDGVELNEEAVNKIGDRPVYSIRILKGNQEITSLNGKQITISIPYEPADSEDTDKLVVYYINDQGEAIPVSSSRYDEATGQMIFTTVHLSFYAIGYADVTFSDILNHWAKDNIEFLAARDILSGKGNELFDPEGKVTRAEFVTMLANLAGADISNVSSTGFSDVVKGSWYEGYVDWALANGIVSGYGDGRFGPNDQITREQMAVMLDKFIAAFDLQVQQVNESKAFTDNDQISSWAAASVSKIQQLGIINGRTDGSFAPQDNASRAEAATVIKGCLLLQ